MLSNLCFPYCLHYRQRYSIYLLIYVEGIYISHTANIVNNSHDASLEVRTINLILTAETTNELFGMETSRINGSIGKGVHKGIHNLVTAKFDVQNRLTAINSLEANFCTMLISSLGNRLNMRD